MVVAKPSSPVLQTGDPLYTGMIQCLAMQEGTGSALDLTASGADAVPQANMTWVTTPEGKALRSSSSGTSWAEIAANTALNTPIFTISFWFKTTDTYGGFKTLDGSWSPTERYFIGFDTDRNARATEIQAKIATTGGYASAYSDQADVAVNDNAWHLCVVRYDKVNVTLWIDSHKYVGDAKTNDVNSGSQVIDISTLLSSDSFILVHDRLNRFAWNIALSDALIGVIWADPWRIITPSTATNLTDVAVPSAESLGLEAIAPAVATLFDQAVASASAVGTEDIEGGPVAIQDSLVPTAEQLGQESIASSGIDLVLNTDRTTIVAGESVCFDTVGTSSTYTTKPLHHILYDYDFKDSANLDNTALGFCCHRTFRDPGTYVVACRARDRFGSDVTATASITVQDPDTVFSGTNTVAISNTTDFTGAPAGSTQVTTSDLGTALTHVARGKRVVFKAGGTWTSTGAGVTLGAGPGAALIGSFSTGSKPTFQLTAVTGAVNLITVVNPNELSVVGIRFEDTSGNTTHTTSPLAGDHTGQYVTIADCEVDGFTTGISMNPFSPAFYSEAVYRSICYSRNTDTNIAGSDIYYNAGGDRYGFVGCVIGDGNQHLIRIYKGNYIYIARTDFGAVVNAQHQLKLHADSSLPLANTSTLINFHDNIYRDCPTPWRCAVGPQNSSANEDVNDVLDDGSTFHLETLGSIGHVWFGLLDATIRNAIYIFGTTGGDRVGSFIGRRGIEQLPTGFEQYHCTMYGTGAGGVATLLSVGAYGAGTPVSRNSIVDTTAATTSQISDGTITGGGSLVGDAKFVAPASENFALQGTSLALDGGVAVDVINAFNSDGLLRNLAGNTPDAGAYEETGTGAQSIVDVSVASSESVGQEAVSGGATVLEDLTVPSGAQVGQEAVAGGSVTLDDVGVASGEQIGQELISSGGTALQDVNVPSGESTGQEAVSPGPATLADVPVPSGESVGQEGVSGGSVTIEDIAVASSATVGMEAISVDGSGVQTIYLTGRLYNQVPLGGRLFNSIPLEGQL